MRRMMVSVILAVMVILTGCGQMDDEGSGVPSQTTGTEKQEPQTTGHSDRIREPRTSSLWDSDALMKELYTEASYSVSYSALIDTYLIACGLYFDFDSPYLFPADAMVDYEETIEYFSPYKDHAFIQDLGAFVDGQGMNASMNVYVPLLQYAVSSKENGECMGNIQSYAFQTDEAFYDFLENLHRFYDDTHAAAFFERSSIHRQLEQHIQSGMAGMHVTAYFNAAESYTGTKDKLFPQQTLHYATCLSVYKSRNNASFHHIPVNGDLYFLSYQSPLGYDGNFHIQDMLETTIHESLHPFINPGVEQQQELIQSLAGNKNPADYTSSIYVNMPWYRITDEAIVRAVQASIYKEAGQGDETAAKQLLDRQTGIANLYLIYDSLADYNVARYASLIGTKSPTKCDAQLTESNFQTHPRRQIPGLIKNKKHIDILTGIVYNNPCVVRRERITGISCRCRGVAQLG